MYAVFFSSLMSCNNRSLFPFLVGANPKNENLSAGSPDAAMEKVNADTPGMNSGSIPAFRASLIIRNPGSAITGVPASDNTAIFRFLSITREIIPATAWCSLYE